MIEISKSYSERPALDRLSLTVGKGEVVGLFGSDGAGKSTCFYSILGLVKLDSGRIELGGTDISRLPFYRRAILGLGYLPEQTSIFRGLTVEKNILAMLELNEPDADIRRARLDDLLEALDLVHLRTAKATSLSGGERRRCEVARALALEPQIMVLDEPFAGIDPLTVASIKQMIGEMRRRGIGILLTDQNVPEAIGVVDRTYVLDAGVKIFEGSPGAMLRDPMVIERYLGEEENYPVSG
ncbi:LPS export ABC transporter ATP-binding protein [Aurantiacibacter sp. MUD11]|uniref:LPS export ABC transporter ATP-binding protein n=1 Tax=Aurantiacibacter sp. MUD11 TaxID=3003265 RepID=UPI0022AAF713|nr:LPS export ABC transporter ATP-binding protein [Aurantiacibacter sp. MUD11]WAT18009.1 LPS export ABC transporter ATP-binding protein [Aurantiacibacter sp. MUD11]